MRAKWRKKRMRRLKRKRRKMRARSKGFDVQILISVNKAEEREIICRVSHIFYQVNIAVPLWEHLLDEDFLYVI
uniref:60S ribosomal protein L41 n=1 Tax=Glossina palpalis gambiensis TaxID=67801 RepID=A0A1B0BSK3_9MUSC